MVSTGKPKISEHNLLLSNFVHLASYVKLIGNESEASL